MSELLCIARLKIHPGKLNDFKRLSARCMEIVRTCDTGTLQYETYLNTDQTECLVIERYRDSQALLDQRAHLRATMSELQEVCSAEGEICGIPSEDLMDQLRGSSLRQFWPFQKFPDGTSSSLQNQQQIPPATAVPVFPSNLPKTNVSSN